MTIIRIYAIIFYNLLWYYCNMVQRVVHNYYTFFDETLSSSTYIVLFITILIFLVGTLIPSVHAQSQYMKGSILESTSEKTQNIVVIGGVEYEVRFEKIN